MGRLVNISDIGKRHDVGEREQTRVQDSSLTSPITSDNVFSGRRCMENLGRTLPHHDASSSLSSKKGDGYIVPPLLSSVRALTQSNQGEEHGMTITTPTTAATINPTNDPVSSYKILQTEMGKEGYHDANVEEINIHPLEMAPGVPPPRPTDTAIVPGDDGKPTASTDSTATGHEHGQPNQQLHDSNDLSANPPLRRMNRPPTTATRTMNSTTGRVPISDVSASYQGRKQEHIEASIPGAFNVSGGQVARMRNNSNLHIPNLVQATLVDEEVGMTTSTTNTTTAHATIEDHHEDDNNDLDASVRPVSSTTAANVVVEAKPLRCIDQRFICIILFMIVLAVCLTIYAMSAI